MTLKEISDIFKTRLKLESLKRKTPELTLDEKIIAYYISEAQQDIQMILKVLQSSTNLTLNSSTYYALPSNFGEHITVYSSTTKLDEISFSEYLQSPSGNYYAIIAQNGGYSLYTNLQTGTLTVYYYVDTRHYQPSLSSSQSWGDFNGIVYTGSLMLPDRYSKAVILYMLAQIYDEFYVLYNNELQNLRLSRVFSITPYFPYSLGGFDEDVTTSGDIVVGTSVPSAVVKTLRFRFTDTGGAVIMSDSGWTSTPTIVNDLTEVTVNSADGEFSYVHLDATGVEVTYSITASVITITPNPTSGYGTVEILIEIYI